MFSPKGWGVTRKPSTVIILGRAGAAAFSAFFVLSPQDASNINASNDGMMILMIVFNVQLV
jgi:hypothetical protein